MLSMSAVSCPPLFLEAHPDTVAVRGLPWLASLQFWKRRPALTYARFAIVAIVLTLSS